MRCNLIHVAFGVLRLLAWPKGLISPYLRPSSKCLAPLFLHQQCESYRAYLQNRMIERLSYKLLYRRNPTYFVYFTPRTERYVRCIERINTHHGTSANIILHRQYTP